jgi:hypothetical protein
MIDKHCGTCTNNVGTTEVIGQAGNIICEEFSKTLPNSSVNPALSAKCAYWTDKCGGCSGKEGSRS